jgi:acyl-CoA reductase-like NAD-dependent aldehyde dehydrogenase
VTSAPNPPEHKEYDMTETTTDTVVRRYQHFIDGRWVGREGSDTIARHSPSTGQLVAEFAAGDVHDAHDAIAAARRTFDHSEWAHTGGAERGRLLAAVADRIRLESEYLARIEVEESGKTIRVARADLRGVAGHFDCAAGLAAHVTGESFADLGADFTAVTVREPVGVVGLIVPWNFPALILSQKLPYALAAGCTVVIKPAEITSGTACEIVRICQEAGIPDGVINLVTGVGAEVGQAITESDDVDLVSFTGSTASGRKVIAASVGNIKRLSLELGGKAATIVCADADLDDAVDGALFAITFNQGECCVSGTRLLIEESIADEFLAALVARAQALKVGDPFDESTDIGALIHAGHLRAVLDLVATGETDGATLLSGGTQLHPEGHEDGQFMAPTIFDHVSPQARIFQQEIFGPVLSVTRFRTLKEAVDLANDTIYGLANSVWTKNIDTAHHVSRRLRSGTVWVNTTIDGAPQLPLGGYKQSGYGREAGKIGMEEFTNVKTVQTRLGKRTPAYPPVS